MRIQVLSIGEIQSGQGRNGTWHRRTFQVYEPESQVAGNIPVYDDENILNQYKSGGIYDAKVTARAGQNGRLELTFSELKPVPKQ